MHRIDGPGATVDNRFTDGDPVGGVQATMVTDDWMNDVQEELISILAAGSITPVKGVQNQVLTAISALIRSIGAGLVGSSRNAKMTVPTASATATFTADELILEASLGGSSYRLASFSQVINLAINGPGGMDTGSAPLGGYVAIYALCNTTGSTRALLATNATSAVQPEVYAGNLFGYSASALVGVWPTDATGKFAVGSQIGRWVIRLPVPIINTSTVQVAYASLGVASAIPRNARRAKLIMSGINTTPNTVQLLSLASDASGCGAQNMTSGVVLSGNGNSCNGLLEISTAQTMFYRSANTGGGTPTFNADISGYEF